MGVQFNIGKNNMEDGEIRERKKYKNTGRFRNKKKLDILPQYEVKDSWMPFEQDTYESRHMVEGILRHEIDRERVVFQNVRVIR